MKLTTADTRFSKLIRDRDGWRCARCGKPYPKGSRGYHCSHYMGRTNKSTRFLPTNCDGLCYGCHSHLEDRKQTKYRDWKIEQIGLEAVEEIEAMSRRLCRMGGKDFAMVNTRLKSHGLEGLGVWLLENLVWR